MARESDTLARDGPFEAVVRSVITHDSRSRLKMQTLANSEKEIRYSRKPGFTDTRLRPFARRREITAWPLLVFIRLRNPCVFER